MKIAIDISQIVHEGTGVATYTRELVRNLLKIDKENEYILFGISLRKRGILENFFTDLTKGHQNVVSRFYSIPPSLATVVWNDLHIFSLNNLIGDIDIFHSSDWIQPPVKAKKVTTIHDLVVYKYPETSHPKIVSTHKRRLEWVKKECDAIIVDSQATKKDVIEELNIVAEKINVIYLAVSEKFHLLNEESLKEIKKKYNIEDNFILSIGTAEPRKNLKRLIQAYHLIKSDKEIMRVGKLDLMIGGNKGWGDAVGVKDADIRGYMSSDDLTALYNAASLFVFPSLYEGFGLPVLEAMACGCPVITSNQGSLKEIAEGYALGCDPYDEENIAEAIKKVYINKSLQHILKKKGIDRAKEFTWEKTARMTLEVYRRLVQ
jgi:glycosyltransferase involved in cell wall biosynthesis